MIRVIVLASILGLGLVGCMPPNSAARLVESAYDLNTAARFGRMDIASELVREAAKEKFTQHRSTWGRSIRIVDYEMGEMKIRKDGDADVLVVLTWQRVDETTMRSTELTQRWTTNRGNWALVSEEEHGGDPGLITEITSIKHDDATPPLAPNAQMRFQEHVIYEQ